VRSRTYTGPPSRRHQRPCRYERASSHHCSNNCTHDCPYIGSDYCPHYGCDDGPYIRADHSRHDSGHERGNRQSAEIHRAGL
jgi:hypothetical protein